MPQDAVRKIAIQPEKKSVPIHNPQIEKKPSHVPLSRFEGTVLAVTSLVIMFLMVSVVSAKIALSKAQYDLQTVNQRITSVQNKNVDKKQEVSELSSRSRLMDVAKKVGLTMNEQNIRNVNK
ncbi:cell division protein FtsL [Liquorilactobacillus capillatus]|nr:cell division protein FtsL [Liquorilactobacillus capillatus]